MTGLFPDPLLRSESDLKPGQVDLASGVVGGERSKPQKLLEWLSGKRPGFDAIP